MKSAFEYATGSVQDYPSNFNSVSRFHIRVLFIRVFCRAGFTIALWRLAPALTRLPLKALAVPAPPKSIASHRNGDMERDLWIGQGEPICERGLEVPERKCRQPGTAACGPALVLCQSLILDRPTRLFGCDKQMTTVVAEAQAALALEGREIPSFPILSCNVERFIPRRAAAPFGPATTQAVSRRAPRMCSRSASASVLEG